MKLVWPTPTLGAENVTEIVILASLENNSFIQMDTIQVGTTFPTEALVQNLKPSTSYRFKLLLLTKWGCMPEPEVCTEETRTKPEPRALRLRSEAQLADDSEWPNTQVYVPLKKEVKRARKDFTLTTGQSGGVRKYIIGGEHKDLDQDKVLLVVGGTGAGKTTLINSMVNYLYEVKKEDEFRFRLVSQMEETQESGYSTKVKSKTKWVTAFVLNNTRLQYRLTVVDTPGFGDTEGIQRDKETTRYIKEWFSQKGPDGLDRLDAVCMVVKSSETRLTHQAQFELNQVVALFGKDMESNILPLLTFCDASKPPALEALKAANVPFKNYYKFNNSAFFEGSDMDEFQKMFWKLGVSSFEKFFKGIEILPARSLSLSKEVCEKRERLEFQVIALQNKVAQEITQLETMRQEFEVMKNHEADIQRNSDFSYTVVEQRQIMCDLEGTGQHTTNCLNCNITCHESCAYSDDKDKEKCWAMTDGKCRICPLKCEWNFHKNLPYIIARIPLTMRKTNEDLKRKYEQAVSNKELAENMLESIAEQLMKTQSEINADIQLTRQHLKELSKIAMRPSRMTEVSYIEIMITNEKSNAENGWQQRVEHLEHQLKIAKAIAEANDPNYDPLAKYKQSTEGKLNFLAERFPKISEGWLANKAKSAVKKSKAALCAVGNFLIGSEDNSNPAHKRGKKMHVIHYM
uniref:Fibronectin type-III domain-containing protein n=1 Tax=Plectus sambesii TaxID=2011161 RepID=A0A914VP29_9BILA